MSEDRFWSKVRIPPGDACWEWTGATDRRYGQFWWRGRKIRAHRYAWLCYDGFRAIPEGLQVCHHCDNPKCVRPSHLFLGTMSDNLKDAVAKGRHRKFVPPLKGFRCIRGHPATAENMRSDRRCRVCHREDDRRSHARKLALAAAAEPAP